MLLQKILLLLSPRLAPPSSPWQLNRWWQQQQSCRLIVTHSWNFHILFDSFLDCNMLEEVKHDCLGRKLV
jgi:hypothetical protein